jgi:hypothetical protein
MTWAYGGDPSASEKDRVRFLIGDTDQEDQLLQDEEINYLVQVKGSAEGAAIHACSVIMATLAREVDYTIGPESVKASQRLENYKTIMQNLRAMVSGANAAPSYKEPEEILFDLGMHDNFTGGSGLDG